jgi:hypothetical protein
MPRRKRLDNPNRCLLVIDKLQMTRWGSSKMRISELMFTTADVTIYACRSMHLPGSIGFQSFSVGEQEKISNSVRQAQKAVLTMMSTIPAQKMKLRFPRVTKALMIVRMMEIRRSNMVTKKRSVALCVSYSL